MANKTIGDYTAANSIDAANDYLLIEPSGNTVYKKINRNVLLGLSSAPLGTTDSQSPTNKTFDNTNSLTIKDGSLTIQNSSSTTKQAIFSAASITAGQTRTFTFPDASGTLVTTAGTQTLTNKTITSPTLSGGTIDNSTITVDSIAGHTSSTLVTVANLQISNGVLNSANAVTATSVAAGAIQPQALTSGTGSGWSYQSWVPSWTNVTVGNGTVVAKYIQTGKQVTCRLSFIMGSTSAITGLITFSLPVTAVSYPNIANGIDPLGLAIILDNGVNSYPADVRILTTTTAILTVWNASSTYVFGANTSATVPITFGTADGFTTTFSYEAV